MLLHRDYYTTIFPALCEVFCVHCSIYCYIVQQTSEGDTLHHFYRFGNLPKVTQMVSCGRGTWIQVCLTPKSMLTHYTFQLLLCYGISIRHVHSCPSSNALCFWLSWFYSSLSFFSDYSFSGIFCGFFSLFWLIKVHFPPYFHSFFFFNFYFLAVPHSIWDFSSTFTIQGSSTNFYESFKIHLRSHFS